MDYNQEAASILKSIFGHTEFRKNQLNIISSILSGKDTLVLMPTGGGKSLCYQIPGLVLSGTAIVISPLIALMKDQVDSLTRKGVEAAYLNSSLSRGEQAEVFRLLKQGHLKFLYVSPERLSLASFREALKSVEISLFAIDEAHCVSQWGHDFRPEYMQIGQFTDEFESVPKIALTATAGETTREEMIENLNLSFPQIFISSFDRPNIQYEIQKKGKKLENYKRLDEFIKSNYPQETGIVYCLSRKKTEDIAEFLKCHGHQAFAYHAGMSTDKRQRVQNRFLKEKGTIIVATIAFGMGIDQPNVRFVAHLDLSKCLESYYQETGRAGRDGAPAKAWMLYGKQEIIMLKRMMNKGTSSVKRRRANAQKLDAMLGICETTNCRREVLLNYFSDPFEGPCHNCDNCLKPNHAKTNVTNLALMALKTVHESKQKFDIQTMTDVLVGSLDEKQTKKGLADLSTHNLGLNYPEAFWLSLYRQLVANGILKMGMDGSTNLFLTEKSLEVLRGERDVWLRDDVKKNSMVKKAPTPVRKKVQRKARKSSTKSRLTKTSKNKITGDTLFEYLKVFRGHLAKTKRTKAFKIFPDRTLLEMSQVKPTSLEELSELYGVGPKKLKKYGEVFLKAIEKF